VVLRYSGIFYFPEKGFGGAEAAALAARMFGSQGSGDAV
jgi:hypothetical protein